MVMIIINHYSQLIYPIPPELISKHVAVIGVSLFFFFSGIGIGKKQETNLKNYFQRCINLYLALIISNIFFANTHILNKLGGVFIFSSLNPFGWFLIVLILLNIGAFISGKFKFIPLWISTGVLCGCFSILNNAPNSLTWISFIIGYYIVKRYKCTLKTSIIFTVNIIFIVTYIVYCYSKYLNTPFLLFNFIIMVVSSCSIIGIINRSNRYLELLGKYSLSIYLMHSFAFYTVSRFPDLNIFYKTVYAIILSLICVMIFNWIYKLTTKQVEILIQKLCLHAVKQ